MSHYCPSSSVQKEPGLILQYVSCPDWLVLPPKKILLVHIGIRVASSVSFSNSATCDCSVCLSGNIPSPLVSVELTSASKVNFSLRRAFRQSTEGLFRSEDVEGSGLSARLAKLACLTVLIDYINVPNTDILVGCLRQSCSLHSHHIIGAIQPGRIASISYVVFHCLHTILT